MIVECIREVPPKAQHDLLGDQFRPNKQTFGVTLGKKYLVYGLHIRNGNIWILHHSGTDYLLSAPLSLFSIVDEHPSSFWVVRPGFDRNGEHLSLLRNIQIWPELFFQKYFLADLADGIDRSLVSAFERLEEELLEEAGISRPIF